MDGHAGIDHSSPDSTKPVVKAFAGATIDGTWGTSRSSGLTLDGQTLVTKRSLEAAAQMNNRDSDCGGASGVDIDQLALLFRRAQLEDPQAAHSIDETVRGWLSGSSSSPPSLLHQTYVAVATLLATRLQARSSATYFCISPCRTG